MVQILLAKVITIEVPHTGTVVIECSAVYHNIYRELAQRERGCLTSSRLQVQILYSRPQILTNGPMDNWLSYRPFTARCWVRIPVGSPNASVSQLVEGLISNQYVVCSSHI